MTRREQALAQAGARLGRFADRVTVLAGAPASTNDVAAGLGAAGAPDGTTVVADGQTAGRGRYGRRWFSPPGAGLYVSSVLRPPRPALEPGAGVLALVTLGAAVGLADAIERSVGLAPVIKWPNDLVVEHEDRDGRRMVRKLAGILAEGHELDKASAFVVLGFGVNVARAAYPGELAATATSLEAETGRPVDADAVLIEALAALARVIDALAVGDPASVLVRWSERSPSASGAPVEWDGGGIARRGVTAGIDPDGALRVREGSTTHRLTGGTLVWL